MINEEVLLFKRLDTLKILYLVEFVTLTMKSHFKFNIFKNAQL